MVKQNFTSLFQELINLDHVTGVGHGYKLTRGRNTGQKAIIVLVEKKANKGDLKRSVVIPKTINGTPTDVIEVGNIRLLNGRTGMMRPAQPGSSIGHYKISAGTFGAVVKDITTGEKLILSNNHVLANLTNGVDERSAIGDIILQPGVYDGGNKDNSVIGHLERFIPLYKELITPQCKIAKLFESILNKCVGLFKPQYRIQVLRQNPTMNLVDCAVAKPLDAQNIITDILEIGSILGLKEAYTGMEIKKSGRSSGLTHSLVLATDVTLKVNVSQEEYGVFTDQILAGPMSMPGDSGSLILTEDNYAVGLLFAGSEQATMFNRIDNVLAALNISLMQP